MNGGKVKKKIIIIEDDVSINQGIRIMLGDHDYDFCQFYALKDVKGAESADLIILDINLPDGSGLDFLAELRKKSMVPVLILTANDTEIDEVTGLQLGADDYVTKPFSLMVLRLRVQNLLERSEKTDHCYTKNGLVLDFDHLIFTKDGLEIELSKTEMRLLKYLTENEGMTLSREKLIEYVWQDQQYVDGNALSVAIKRLRGKIEDKDNQLIHTVYGIGYTFRWES